MLAAMTNPYHGGGMAKIKSWEVSDSFWERVEPLIPKPQRDPNKAYKRKSGGGRKPMPPRRIFEAIMYVLRTGCQWKALPKEFTEAPVQSILISCDGCMPGFFSRSGAPVLPNMMKWRVSPGAGKALTEPWLRRPWRRKQLVGTRPTGGKKGTKRHLLVDGRGVPLSLVVTGANRHDVTQLELVLVEIIIERPEDIEQHLCADKAYDGSPASK